MSKALLQPIGRSDGVLHLRDRSVRCIFGAAGIAAQKQEGDEATPAGLFPLRRVLYRADRLARPACGVLCEPIAPDDGWCDDPTHEDYNRPVVLPHPARHERLWRSDPLYDLIAVLGYNDDPVRRRLGSAIFLHVASPDGHPTAGCVALSLQDLLWSLGAGLTEIEITPPAERTPF